MFTQAYLKLILDYNPLNGHLSRKMNKKGLVSAWGDFLVPYVASRREALFCGFMMGFGQWGSRLDGSSCGLVFD